MAHFQTIGTDRLDRLLERNETVLIEVTSDEEYQEGHLPGAINIDIRSENFHEEFQQTVFNFSTPVVLYAQDRSSGEGPAAADRATELGYENVFLYEDGKAGWKDSGRDLEGVVREVETDVA